jgi:3',5'-cyclic AMP phosphodiesterase CpdA
MTGTALKLAHLSDVHLGPIVGFDLKYWNAKRATGFLNWRRNRRHAYRRDVLDRIVADVKAQGVDHTLVSGDLCNIGLPAEMDAALTWLATVGPPDRVAVVPGNHDIYTTLGRDQGVMRWAAYMTGDAAFQFDPSEVERRQTVRLAFPYVRRLGPVALIALNSAVETPPLVAAGELGADQRSRLAVILDETAAQGLIRVVMLHHAPLPGQTRRSHALNDAEALRSILNAHGAELVVHGHLHRAVRASVARGHGRGSIPVLGVPSASLGVIHPHEPLLTIDRARIIVESRGLAHPEGPVGTIERLEIPLVATTVAASD